MRQWKSLSGQDCQLFLATPMCECVNACNPQPLPEAFAVNKNLPSDWTPMQTRLISYFIYMSQWLFPHYLKCYLCIRAVTISDFHYSIIVDQNNYAHNFILISIHTAVEGRVVLWRDFFATHCDSSLLSSPTSLSFLSLMVDGNQLWGALRHPLWQHKNRKESKQLKKRWSINTMLSYVYINMISIFHH